jgi:flagellar motor switch protein FliN/FliY
MAYQPPAIGKLLGNVSVAVSVELGRTEMRLKDVLELGPESIVPLDRLTDELLDVMVNGKAIAKAEVAAQDGRFALRIVELVSEDGPAPNVERPAPVAETASEAPE